MRCLPPLRQFCSSVAWLCSMKRFDWSPTHLKAFAVSQKKDHERQACEFRVFCRAMRRLVFESVQKTRLALSARNQGIFLVLRARIFVAGSRTDCGFFCSMRTADRSVAIKIIALPSSLFSVVNNVSYPEPKTIQK